ncbi:MAG TPA: methyltransferase domain-containing protein [Ktedonobacterales bacterium]|nr:methyltransferase domain-containing protein [Ktedonobacterales bacterium]
MRLGQRDNQARELLDAPDVDDATLHRNLADIRRINFVLGWTHYAAAYVVRTAASSGVTSFTLLDVAAGSADIAVAIARRARRQGLSASIVASDLSEQVVRIASAAAASVSEVRVVQQNALNLGYPDGAFDIALCTLALHHFDLEDATTVLRNLGRVGRRVVVFDAARSPLAWAGAWLLTRLLRMDAMTRHDAPMSVARSYNRRELAALARRAGLRDARVWVAFPFRLALDARGGVE